MVSTASRIFKNLMSNLINLVDKILKHLEETTASNNITYFPSSFTTVRNTIASLGGMKSKWGIKILDNKDDYYIGFEDKLNVIVPKMHYEHFNSNVLKVKGLNEVYLGGMLKEAIEVDFNELLVTLTTSLRKIPIIANSLELMNAWLSAFPDSKVLNTGNKVLLNLGNYDRNVSELVGKLKKEYAEDKGFIETLISTIEDQRPLNKIDYISNYSYLAGCRITSIHNSEPIQLDLFVNLALQPTQMISVDELDIAMEMKLYRDVRVVRNLIYPVGGAFRPYIFDNLKDVIEGIV